jgi:hypothetical protein
LKISGARERLALTLIFIALIAAIPRLVLGASQFIEYDGYWHVFIAQQDNWHNFWRDIKVNAHPPLFFLLLKAVIHLGRSTLIYRSISLLTGTASVFLVGWVAHKLTRSTLWAYQAALFYGLAIPGIIISNEVRSYMLSAFFILLSFSALLDLAVCTDSGHMLRRRAGFALAAILACLSHYYAFFYAGAAMLLLVARYGLRRYRGQKASLLAEAATILPVAGVIVFLFQTHAGALAQIQGHLVPYYYDPMGQEKVSSFLIRNWKNLVNLFLPFQISSDAVALALLALSVAGGLALLGGLLRSGNDTAVRASWTMAITAAMLFGITISGVAGKYPFGGDLRQQFILFPFFVFCAATFADRLAAPLAGRGQLYVNAALALLIIGISTLRFEQYPKISEKLLTSRMETFKRLEPRPAAVYLDQFNLIIFFIYYHDWQWSFVKLPQPIPGIDVYRLSQGNRRMLVFRDTTVWSVKPSEAALYYKLAECLGTPFDTAKTTEVSVFSALQMPPEIPFSNFRSIQRKITALASDSSVCPQRLAVNSLGWYGTFRTSGCTNTELKPPQVTGTFDDVSDEIEYSGPWTRGTFASASAGTISFANDPASSARLSFKGTEVTWVYTKAFNRGIASVKLDGIPRPDIDLYSPRIEWQSRTTFGGLAPGEHTIELSVAGRKDSPATDRFIDVDALVVR